MPDMRTLVVVAVVSVLGASSGSYAAPEAPELPVAVTVSVAPGAVAAGSDAKATVSLVPKPGIKLNKYPKIKIQIPAAGGLVAAAEASIGNASAPAADQLEANYYHGAVDPLTVSFHVDAAATHGRHEVAAKLSYFYCVAASGYCAPAKVAVTIPVTVR